MSYETLIVAFDDASRADAAIDAAHALGIPWSHIRRHPAAAAASVRDAAAAAVADPDPAQPGFWSWLFRRDAEARQIRLYQRALDHGSTVVSIHVLPDELDHVRNLLHGFGPLDLRETPLAA